MIHIANNFVSSTVHASLVSAISRTVSDQLVVVPIRERWHDGLNSERVNNIRFKYVNFNNRFIRYFPLIKVLMLTFKVLVFLKSERKLRDSKLDKVDVVAHNFWSDGMIAFFGSFFIPMRYMMVVRNTDINYFVSKLPHYRWLMRLAIRRSEGLTFVSKSHYLRFQSRWPSLLSCARKVEVIPNGISDWWLDNVLDKPVVRGPQACFVGRFDANKNLSNLVKAARIAHEVRPDFNLVLAGGNEEEFRTVTGLSTIPDFVEVVGKLEKEELLQLYQSSRLFVMPSFTETFGLVYLEALSQGCPVICSSGEGIDGMWDAPFIRAVNPKNVDDLSRKMIELVDAFPKGIPTLWSAGEVGKFGWDGVAERYLEFFV